MVENAEDMKLATEERLQRKIEDMIEKTLGPDKVRAEVSVDMDFDRVATTSETFDPDGRVVRSEVNSDDNNQTQDQENNSVSVQQNLPDAGANNPGARSLSKESRTETTTNYEIAKTPATRSRRWARSSASPPPSMVDGNYGPPGQGQAKLSYQPLDQKELDQIAALVRSAVGYDAKRGDQVRSPTCNSPDTTSRISRRRNSRSWASAANSSRKFASNIGLSVVAILFLLLVLRPLVSRAVEAMAAQAAEGRRLAARPAARAC